LAFTLAFLIHSAFFFFHASNRRIFSSSCKIFSLGRMTVKNLGLTEVLTQVAIEIPSSYADQCALSAVRVRIGSFHARVLEAISAGGPIRGRLDFHVKSPYRFVLSYFIVRSTSCLSRVLHQT
jgi:hypothetical protein